MECAWRHSSLLLEQEKNFKGRWLLLDPSYLHFDCICFHSFLTGTISPLQCIFWWGCSGTNVFSQKTSGMSSCSKGTFCGTRLCGTANPLWAGVHSSCWFAWMVPGGSPYTSEAVLVNNTTSSLQRIMDIFVFLTSYFLWLGRAVLSFLSNVPRLLVDFFGRLFFQRWSYNTWPFPGFSVLCSLLGGGPGWRGCILVPQTPLCQSIPPNWCSWFCLME